LTRVDLQEANTMTIPVSKVRAICTSSEVALVRASRKGELEVLSAAQVKQLAVRARKLLEKWQDLGRDQSRARSRKVGFGDASANTRLKEQIFREALAQFNARLARFESAEAESAKKSKASKKVDWNAEHRASRSAIRKELSATKKVLRAEASLRKRAQAVKPVPESAQSAGSAPLPPQKAAPKARSLPRAVPTAKRPTSTAIPQAGLHRKVVGAAKKARLVSSGKTTRMLGHIGARGKRAQARRDAKK
jgi:hypothetical protein